MAEATFEQFSRWGKAVLATCILLAPFHASAQTEEAMCREGQFPTEHAFRVAQVAGDLRQKLYFFKDYDGCPAHGTECQAKGYVVTGDKLLLAKTHGDWSCALFSGKSRVTVGWVRNKTLVEQPQAAAPDWAGKWKDPGSPGFISVVRKGRVLYVLAKTTSAEMELPDGTRTVNFGQFDGELKLDGNHAHFENQDAFHCTVDFTQVGEFLIVHDNQACGGVNVSFDGVYARVR